MRNLKKLFAVVVVIAVMLTTMIPAAFAEGTTAISADAQACATLGMLQGGGDGVTYAYTQTQPTRIQAAIMLLRLKGLEAAALKATGDNFSDVTATWMKPYGAYLKAHPEVGFDGIGNNKLDPGSKIDAKQYYKVMLTALGYKYDSDFTWNTVMSKAASVGLTKNLDITKFTVNDLAVATIEALKTKAKGSDKTLVEALAAADSAFATKAQTAGLYTIAPVLVTVSSANIINARQVKVVFSGAVENVSATTTTNYTINGSNAALIANGAALQSDNKTVILTLASPLSNPSTNNVITVANVKDTTAPVAKTVATQTFTNVAYSSSTLPTANSVVVVDPTHVKVLFSEPVRYAVGAAEASTAPASTFITVDSGVVPASAAGSTVTVNAPENSLTFTLISALSAGKHTLHVNVGSLQAYNSLAVLPTDLTFDYAAVTGSPTATVVSATPTKVRVQFNRPINKAGLDASITAGNVYAGYSSNVANGASVAVDAAVTGDYSTTYDIPFNTMLGSSITVTIANNTTTPIKDGYGNALTTQTLNANITVDTTKPLVASSTFTNPTFSIVFTKDMDNATATNAQNYTLVDASGNTVTGATSGFSGIVDGAGHPATVTFNHTTYTAVVAFGGSVPAGTYSLKLTGIKDASVMNNVLDTVSLPLSVTSSFMMSSVYANAPVSATSLLVTFNKPIATTGAASELLASNYFLDLANNGSLSALPAGTILTASGTNAVSITFPSAQAYTSGTSKLFVQSNVTDATGAVISVAGVSKAITNPAGNTLTVANIRNIKLISPSIVTFEVTVPLTGTLTASNFTYGGGATPFDTASYANQALSDGTYGAIVYLTKSTAPFDTYAVGGQIAAAGAGQALAALTGAMTPVNGTANAGGLDLYNAGANVVSDKIAPSIASVMTKDTNTNGKIDGLQVVFSEPVNISSITASTFTIDNGYSITSVTPDLTAVTYPATGTKTATNTFMINVGEKLVSDSGVKPALTLATAVTDPSANTLTAGSAVSATADGVAVAVAGTPTITKAGAFWGNTIGDSIVINYTEAVNPTTLGVGLTTVGTSVTGKTFAQVFGAALVGTFATPGDANTGSAFTVALSADGKTVTITVTTAAAGPAATTDPSGLFTIGSATRGASGL